MSFLEAVILGIIQGLTEFLPVSSSGHLVIGKELFGIESSALSFEIVVHAATVLSTIVAFRKEVWKLLVGLFKFKMNAETSYLLKIAISMVPILIVGLFFKEFVEKLFGSGLLVVGVSLLLTSFLLFLSGTIKSKDRALSYKVAFSIGVAQALAVVPGLSRSGTTISAGLLLGVKREEVAKFSFLMVLVPILGQAFIELVSGDLAVGSSGIALLPLMGGFIAAFLAGLFACKTMIALVQRTKLRGFVIYTALVGLLIIVLSYV